MCGISGACCLHKRPKKEECLSGMLRSMRRRGPDARGIKITERAILFHTRLIVVDPENGAQPMTQKENGLEYTIVYNGELYNTEELRKELTAAGIEFFGHSDTEVVLKSYIHWGEMPRPLQRNFRFRRLGRSDAAAFLPVTAWESSRSFTL